MNKSRNSPISVHNTTKKTIINSVRNTLKPIPQEKPLVKENQKASEKAWTKRPDDSWDY